MDFIYDSNTSWFADMWIFERWKFYHRAFIATTEEYLKIVDEDSGVKALESLDLEGIFFIKASPAVSAQSGIGFEQSDMFEEDYKKQNIAPKIIYDDAGRAAFHIYYGGLK